MNSHIDRIQLNRSERISPLASSMESTFDYSAEQKKNIQRAMVGKVKSQTRLSKKQKDFSNRPHTLELLPQFSGVRVENRLVNLSVLYSFI